MDFKLFVGHLQSPSLNLLTQPLVKSFCYWDLRHYWRKESESEVDTKKEAEIKLEATDELDDWIVVETKSPPSKAKDLEHIKIQPKKDLSWKSSSTPNLITTTSVNLFQFTKEKLYNIIKDSNYFYFFYFLNKCLNYIGNKYQENQPHLRSICQSIWWGKVTKYFQIIKQSFYRTLHRYYSNFSKIFHHNFGSHTAVDSVRCSIRESPRTWAGDAWFDQHKCCLQGHF